MANNVKFGFSLDISAFKKGIARVISDTKRVVIGLKAIGKGANTGDWTKATRGLKMFSTGALKLSARPFTLTTKGIVTLTLATARLGKAAKSAWGKLGGGISGLAGLAFKFNMVTQAINTVMGPLVGFARAVSEPAAASEKLALSFEVLLGSADTAKEHVAGLVDYAAHTPFSMDDISQASRALISFGIPAKESTRVLKQLGDVAAMTDASLLDLAMIYGKVANGKIDTMVTKQLSRLTINMKSQLKELRGWSNSDYAEALSGGKLGKRDLDDVLEKMTGEGGQFYKGAERLSTTFSGLVSTMGDNIKLAMGDIGAGINQALKPHISHFTAMVEKCRPMLVSFGRFAGEVVGKWVGKFMKLVDTLDRYKYSIKNVMTPIMDGFGVIWDGLKRAVGWIIDKIGALVMWLDEKLFDGYYRKRWEAGERKAEEERKRAAAEAERRKKQEELEEQQRRAAEAEADRLRKEEAAAQAAEEEYDELIKEYKKKAKEWQQAMDAEKFTKADIGRKRSIVAGEMSALGMNPSGASPDDMLQLIQDKLVALTKEGAVSTERNEAIKKEAERLELLRKQVEELKKQTKSMQDATVAREAEVEAMRLELAGKEEEAKRTRANAEMYKRVQELQQQGFTRQQALAMASEESSLKWQQQEKQKYDAADERAWKPNIIAQNMAQVGNGSRLIDLTQSFDIGRRQLTVQENILRDFNRFRAEYLRMEKKHGFVLK